MPLIRLRQKNNASILLSDLLDRELHVEQSTGNLVARVNGQLMRYVQSGLVVKSVSQASANTTNLISDSELLFPVVANATYDFTVKLLIDTGTADCGFKMSLRVPSTSGVFNLPLISGGSIRSTMVTTTTTQAGGYQVGSNPFSNETWIMSGVFTVGSTGGNAVVQWGQVVSRSVAATVRANSILQFQRIA